MLFKSKAKKAEDMSNKRMDISKDNIRTLINEYQHMEVLNAEKIGVNLDFNYPRMYYYYMCNYAEDIATLIDNERYSALYIVYENFLRVYGMCKNLLETCFSKDKEAYGQLLKNYYSETIKQRADECRWLRDDYLNSSEKEIKFINVRQDQISSLIRQFFPDYIAKLDEAEEDEIYKVVDEIYQVYGGKVDQEDLIVKALNTNSFMSPIESGNALSTWISGKSSAQANIQTVITRVLGKVENRPTLMLNKHEGITEVVMLSVEKSLLDIASMIRVEFDL